MDPTAPSHTLADMDALIAESPLVSARVLLSTVDRDVTLPADGMLAGDAAVIVERA